MKHPLRTTPCFIGIKPLSYTPSDVHERPDLHQRIYPDRPCAASPSLYACQCPSTIQPHSPVGFIPSWRKPLPHPNPCSYVYLCPQQALRVGIFATACPSLDIASACSLSALASAYGFADVVRVSPNVFPVPTLPKPLRNPNHKRNPRARARMDEDTHTNDKTKPVFHCKPPLCDLPRVIGCRSGGPARISDCAAEFPTIPRRKSRILT